MLELLTSIFNRGVWDLKAPATVLGILSDTIFVTKAKRVQNLVTPNFNFVLSSYLAMFESTVKNADLSSHIFLCSILLKKNVDIPGKKWKSNFLRSTFLYFKIGFEKKIINWIAEVILGFSIILISGGWGAKSFENQSSAMSIYFQLFDSSRQ